MKSRFGFLLLLASLCFGSCALADFVPREWQFYKDISHSRGSVGKYGQITIDKEILCKASPGLIDLRIIDQSGHEIPYKLLVDKGQSDERTYNPVLLNKSDVPGKYNTFMLDLSSMNAVSNRITINSSSKNFTCKVEIDGSQDGANWARLRSDGYIFDFSRDYHARNTTVTYPESIYHYLRVKIWHYKEPAINVENASVNWQKSEPAVEMLVFDGLGKVIQTEAENSTDLIMDMGCDGYPSTGMSIESSDSNFHRQVEIAGSKEGKTWVDLGWGSILKYDTPQFKGMESNINFSGSGFRYIRARIRNYDDQPIRISRVRIYTTRNRIFFPTRINTHYKLFYGNPGASAPIYDIQETFRYLQSEPSVQLTLGPKVKNPDFVQTLETGQWLDRNQWALWTALVAVVFILGMIILRMVKQMKSTNQ